MTCLWGSLFPNQLSVLLGRVGRTRDLLPSIVWPGGLYRYAINDRTPEGCFGCIDLPCNPKLGWETQKDVIRKHVELPAPKVHESSKHANRCTQPSGADDGKHRRCFIDSRVHGEISSACRGLGTRLVPCRLVTSSVCSGAEPSNPC